MLAMPRGVDGGEPFGFSLIKPSRIRRARDWPEDLRCDRALDAKTSDMNDGVAICELISWQGPSNSCAMQKRT